VKLISQGCNINAIGIFVAEIYGNFKFASTSNIYGLGILILTLYCVIHIILPKIMLNVTRLLIYLLFMMRNCFLVCVLSGLIAAYIICCLVNVT